MQFLRSFVCVCVCVCIRELSLFPMVRRFERSVREDDDEEHGRPTIGELYRIGMHIPSN